jgi:hypothetical protein
LINNIQSFITKTANIFFLFVNGSVVVMSDLEFSLDRLIELSSRRAENKKKNDEVPELKIYTVFREVIESGDNVWLINEIGKRVGIIRMNKRGKCSTECFSIR